MKRSTYQLTATITKTTDPFNSERVLLVAATCQDQGLDRTDVMAWYLPLRHRRLAHRLAAAIEAGVACPPERKRRDVDGRTYLEHGLKVLGRSINADLRRLGF